MTQRDLQKRVAREKRARQCEGCQKTGLPPGKLTLVNEDGSGASMTAIIRSFHDGSDEKPILEEVRKRRCLCVACARVWRRKYTAEWV